MVVLKLENIEKSFDGNKILKGISLDINKGEFLTVLGSSGCGKTTMLRIIAGLENADKGKVILNEKDITLMPPNTRNINTVFQNYALFPHMNVFENIAYPLKLKGVKKDDIRYEVNEMLKLVKLCGYEKRDVSKLSGGEKQRVSIARAIINKPDILLLDEPLGALDLKLRMYMQGELKGLQKKLGLTFIYVTHDQEEALNMSDRIVVMNKGVAEQTDTPYNIYNFPKTKYTAEFVGERNIFKNEAGKDICILFEKVKIQREKCDIGIEAFVTEKKYLGAEVTYTLKDVNERLIRAKIFNDEDTFQEGERVFVYWDKKDEITVKAEGDKYE